MEKIELNSHIEIDAPTDKIWNVIMDVNNYCNWNPLIKNLLGKMAVGEVIYEVGYVADLIYLPFKMRIKKIQPAYELVYESDTNFITRHLFIGYHKFLLEEINSSKTRFSHIAYFEGIIANIQKDNIFTNVKRLHLEMNEGLKKRVESIREKH